MTPTKTKRHSAILDVVNRGSAHTQQEIAQALARRGVRATQATISRDIQELGLVRSGAGYRSSAALVRELVLSIELVDFLAALAALLDGQGKTDEAEWLHRSALARDACGVP